MDMEEEVIQIFKGFPEGAKITGTTKLRSSLHMIAKSTQRKVCFRYIYVHIHIGKSLRVAKKLLEINHESYLYADSDGTTPLMDPFPWYNFY